jgi:hypothetical protein
MGRLLGAVVVLCTLQGCEHVPERESRLWWIAGMAIFAVSILIAVVRRRR